MNIGMELGVQGVYGGVMSVKDKSEGSEIGQGEPRHDVDLTKSWLSPRVITANIVR